MADTMVIMTLTMAMMTALIPRAMEEMMLPIMEIGGLVDEGLGWIGSLDWFEQQLLV